MAPSKCGRRATLRKRDYAHVRAFACDDPGRGEKRRPCFGDSVMPQHPFPDGELDWSGDNPGIYLKEAEDGPFVTLALWFRVVLSPHGKGNALLLFEDPTREAAWPDVANFCLTDNEPLARYLVENF